ncbi:hypothetical protein GCM10009789_82980 [Kribbella sancticallisti]|uniref:DNA binding domain-containing protein, excisionase family n=1 Tax=Kribbella sancticallisti TaxID=460087 RepID=A0ABN2ETW0_9ACTN
MTFGDEIEQEAVDPLLGQPRMVDDPRISPAQAAVVLGKPVAYVYRLMRLGRLPTAGVSHSSWQLRLSDVEHHRDLGDPIPLKEAARLLRCSTGDVRKLVADGKLTGVQGSRRPVYLREVQQLAAAWGVPERKRGRPRPDPMPAGYTDLRGAAELLRVSVGTARRLAAKERIPAERDAAGYWQFSIEKLHLVRRARLAADRRGLPTAATDLRRTASMLDPDMTEVVPLLLEQHFDLDLIEAVTFDDDGQADLLAACSGVCSGDAASLSLLFGELADQFEREPKYRDEVLDALRPAAALARQVQARNVALRVRDA